MSAPAPLLRPGILEGLVVAVAGESDDARALASHCRGLGAVVEALAAGTGEDEAAAAVERVLSAHRRLDVLVVDAAGAFTAASANPLRAACDGAWVLARPAALQAWIPDEGEGGKLVLLAPPPGAGEHAEATRAALENMARELSIEWARYGIRTAAIAPADDTASEDVRDLVAYLASPAGDYYSGCLFTLGAVTPRSR